LNEPNSNDSDSLSFVLEYVDDSDQSESAQESQARDQLFTNLANDEADEADEELELLAYGQESMQQNRDPLPFKTY